MPANLNLNIRLDPDLDRRIEDYRKQFPRIPTRTDAVKALIQRGLDCPPPPASPPADATPTP